MPSNQLKRFDELMALMGGVGHEINNPLTIILGFLDLELFKDSLSAESKERLKLMRQEVLKVEDLTNKLVRMAYANQLPQDSLDLNEVIRHNVELAQTNYSIQFNLELEPQLPPISFVPIQINQIFRQLIQNAHEAFEREENPDPQMTFRTFQKNQKIICQVQDNGPGISQELSSQIFKPFVTTQTNLEGQGIGLNLCYEWLKHHKAKVTLLKNNEKGCTFQLEFPFKT